MTNEPERDGSNHLILATGVFDLFHVGHLRYLEHARRQGTHLIVGVVSDEHVMRTKGKRPTIPLSQRLEIVQGLSCVDEARVQPTSTNDIDSAREWIPSWGCQHVVVGGLWEGHPSWQALAVHLSQHQITVSFAPHTPDVSSTLIKARLRAAAGETGKW